MAKRVRVVGASGSGKTRLARRLSHRLQLPYLELDALHHGPDWETVPQKELRAAVQRALDRFESLHGGWIVDGNYPAIGDLFSDADTVVWLDYPRHLVMQRVVRRTARRMLLRTPLWHGNRERWRSLLSRDPDTNIILWAWTRHPIYRGEYEAASNRDGRTWVRLRDSRETQRWLDEQRPATRPTDMG